MLRLLRAAQCLSSLRRGKPSPSLVVEAGLPPSWRGRTMSLSTLTVIFSSRTSTTTASRSSQQMVSFSSASAPMVITQVPYILQWSTLQAKAMVSFKVRQVWQWTVRTTLSWQEIVSTIQLNQTLTFSNQSWHLQCPSLRDLWKYETLNAGTFYVSDWGNSRVQIFDQFGSFLAFINTGGSKLYGPQVNWRTTSVRSDHPS